MFNILDMTDMATSKRHRKLVARINYDIMAKYEELEKDDKINAMQEEAALVHYGRKSKGEQLILVDLAEIEDKEKFISAVIDDLEYVQPDFILFKDNIYWENKRQTRTAGQPDLIVEVWSPSNGTFERNLKFNLYASSPITEHWYIEQDNNVVECYRGTERLPDQNLRDILRTQDGIEFDLRYLALDQE